MAGKIPQTFIDDLLNRVDIVDVIDSRVQLKKAGKEFQACCPFHNEKTPSFTVSPQKQFYYCFGCGASGSSIGFLMEFERLEFVEAVEELARIAGVEVPYEQGMSDGKRSQLDALYQALEKAQQFFTQSLRSKGDAAVDYLKQRGLSGEIAAEYGIGFAPAGWDNLIQHSGDSALPTLHKAGMIVEKQAGQYYDRFRNRIMFPIRDRRGRVIAFGGRIIDPEDNPKYLNSPETPVFHKGRELYGLFEARKAMRTLERIMVVEGYMDVVALAQMGVRYAVATLGTATSHSHLETIFRLVHEIVFCFDGDKAGRKAAWRAMETVLPLMHDGRQTTFLFLPEGEDPDTLIRKEGKDAFETRITQAMSLDRYLIDELSAQVDLTRSDGKARLIELARPYTEKLPDGLFRQFLVKQLSEIVGLGSRDLNMDGGMATGSVAHNNTASNQAVKKDTAGRSPVRYAITLLLQNPEFVEAVPGELALAEVKLPGMQILSKMIEILQNNPNLNTAALLEHWRDDPASVHLAKLTKVEIPGIHDESKHALRDEFLDTLRYLSKQTQEDRWIYLQQKAAKEGLDEAEKLEYRQLLGRQSDTTEPLS